MARVNESWHMYISFGPLKGWWDMANVSANVNEPWHMANVNDIANVNVYESCTWQM